MPTAIRHRNGIDCHLGTNNDFDSILGRWECEIIIKYGAYVEWSLDWTVKRERCDIYGRLARHFLQGSRKSGEWQMRKNS
jgi:hypothetical protein